MQRTTLVLTLLIAISGAGFSQDVASSPRSIQRDASAVAAVQNAVNAMGGTNAIGAVQDCVATGSILPAPGSPQAADTFRWKHAGSQFRYESTGTSQTNAIVSGHGRPSLINGGKVEGLNGDVARASIAPHLLAVLLLRSLNDPNIAMSSEGTTTVGSRPAIQVRLWDDSSPGFRVITVQTWILDAATGLPLRLEYKLPDNKRALDTTDAALELSDFRLVSGVVVPFQINTYIDAKPFSTIKLDSVTFNTGVTADQFDAPVGGVQ